MCTRWSELVIMLKSYQGRLRLLTVPFRGPFACPEASRYARIKSEAHTSAWIQGRATSAALRTRTALHARRHAFVCAPMHITDLIVWFGVEAAVIGHDVVRVHPRKLARSCRLLEEAVGCPESLASVLSHSSACKLRARGLSKSSQRRSSPYRMRTRELDLSESCTSAHPHVASYHPITSAHGRVHCVIW